ncbi:MAG: M23 family metallopeptidase [Deltaproteobacteria bacterium]|nr:MAG: M23 family metallopeptidase [Deltaproteobacteria bacterium]
MCPPPADPCWSATLGRQVDSGTCVQVSYAACGQQSCGWFVCDDGAWACTDRSSCSGEAFDHAACGQSCWSQTLGRQVPDGDCVQVSYAGCGQSQCGWYACANGSWQCTQAGACTGTAHPHAVCGSSGGGGSCGNTPPTDWVWPVAGSNWVCQAYGRRITYQPCGFHTGVDICAGYGQYVYAAADGQVVWVGPLWLQGPGVGRGDHAIVIRHGPNLYSTYSHNQAAYVQVGDCVTRGQPIGEIGSEGYSSGPHLHFEILEGTPFTGNWRQPFNDACAHYRNPGNYVP